MQFLATPLSTRTSLVQELHCPFTHALHLKWLASPTKHLIVINPHTSVFTVTYYITMYTTAGTLRSAQQYLLEQPRISIDFGKRTTSLLKLNLPLHTKPSNVVLKPIYSVPPTAVYPISTHLSTAGASNSALLTLCALSQAAR